MSKNLFFRKGLGLAPELARGIALAMSLCTFLARAEQPPAPDVLELPGSSDSHSTEVDVRDLVLTALKMETTVQEAPSIIWTLTGDEIRDMGFRSLGEAVGGVPGFLTYSNYMGTFPHYPSGFGLQYIAGPLLLHDGLNVLDPFVGRGHWLDETLPIQMVKRVEILTGPGGVAWGSDTLTSLVSMSTKTADDFQGIRAYVGGGSGRGRPGAFKSYLLAGQKLFGGLFKFLAHVSFETWRYAESPLPPVQFHNQGEKIATDTYLWDGTLTANAPQSHMVLFSGNAQAGPFSLHWHVPWGRYYFPSTEYNYPIQYELPEDQLDCTNPANKKPFLDRVDPDRLARKTATDSFSRHVMISYRDRFWRDRLQTVARVFFQQWEEDGDYTMWGPSSAMVGGVSMGVRDKEAVRVGSNVDVSLRLPRNSELLTGGEVFWDDLRPAFYGMKPPFTDDMASSTSLGEVCQPPRDGVLCPDPLMSGIERITTGVFLLGNTSPWRTLSLSAGIRGQFYGGQVDIEPVLLVSGGARWSPTSWLNLKTTYGEGFRPPGLEYMAALGGGATFFSFGELRSERSRSIQGEVGLRVPVPGNAIKRLDFNANYSYTWVVDVIELMIPVYANASDFGIHSAQGWAHVGLQHGSAVSIGHTFVHASSRQKGRVRVSPPQWSQVQAKLNLWRERLYLTTNLVFYAAHERLATYPTGVLGPSSWGGLDSNGHPLKLERLVAEPSDLMVVRVPPAVTWNAGLRFFMREPNLRLTFDVYNLLNEVIYGSAGQLSFAPGNSGTSSVRVAGFSFLGGLEYSL